MRSNLKQYCFFIYQFFIVKTMCYSLALLLLYTMSENQIIKEVSNGKEAAFIRHVS